MPEDDLLLPDWAQHLPEPDRARLREELESWRATAIAWRDGYGDSFAQPVERPVEDAESDEGRAAQRQAMEELVRLSNEYGFLE